MEQICKKLHEIRKAGMRICFVSGNFNVLHTGHIRLLRFAKELADCLIVGVLPRNDYNAVVSPQDRLAGIGALSMVDYSFIMERPIEEVLAVLRPDFVVKGKEHEALVNLELPLLEKYGGKLVFSAGFIRPSEEDASYTEVSALPPRLRIPADYFKRRNIDPQILRDTVNKMPQLRVCVVGDVIVDEYISCDALGMSQEDPSLVVAPTRSSMFLGGAGIVAAHAAGLGAQVSFFSICGDDDRHRFVCNKLEQYNVQPFILVDQSRPTTLKQRFRCMGKTLLRVSHLRQHAVGSDFSSAIFEALRPVIPETDMLIFSDFNYGCLPQPLVDQICAEVQLHGVPFVADSQSSSQTGDVSRYQNAILLTPTEREARLATHDFESGLVVLAEKLMEKANAKNTVLTLGASGMLIQNHNPGSTDRIPALNEAAHDVAGAGDSLLITMAMALAAGSDIWHASFLGALAAGVQVSREGNVPLERGDILRGMEF